MAKTSKKAKNLRQEKLIEKYRAQREELRAIIKNPMTEDEERDEAYQKLRKLPRDSNPNRYRRRCLLTGRPRGNYKKFRISRVMLRELANEGVIPGMKKSSW